MTTVPWKQLTINKWRNRIGSGRKEPSMRSFGSFDSQLKILKPCKIASARNGVFSSGKIKDLSKLMRLKVDSYVRGRSTPDENLRDQKGQDCGRTSSRHGGSNFCFLDSGEQRNFPSQDF
ncbi:unnamed protein product [Linum trigynum]|uniref:Uncharacterized protein n=1 Tax=Linum trigynum TaxID=586398 RepID=A0AAV2FNG1_9ROSI